MTDFRNIQHRIAAIRCMPSREEFNEDGFVLLRQTQSEAKALLSQPFEQTARGRGTEEQHKVQLRRLVYAGLKNGVDCSDLSIENRIIVDAAVRRHRAQKVFLRATAALRWVNSRAAILQGQRVQAIHQHALHQIRLALQAVGHFDYFSKAWWFCLAALV